MDFFSMLKEAISNIGQKVAEATSNASSAVTEQYEQPEQQSEQPEQQVQPQEPVAVQQPEKEEEHKIPQALISDQQGTVDLSNWLKQSEDQRLKDIERMALNPNFDAGFDPQKSFTGTIDSMSDWDMPTKDSNRTYNDLFMSEGYQPKEDQDNWWDHAGNFAALSGFDGTNPEFRTLATYHGNPSDTAEVQNQAAGELSKAVDRYHDSGVDDGTLNENNLTSNFMTGDRYIQYRNAGIPGMDVEDIDPNAIYNKRAEQGENGFLPYVPNDSALLKMSTQNVLAMPSDLASGLRNLREDVLPYTIDVDGRKISSADFDQDKAYKYHQAAAEEAREQVENSPEVYEIIGKDGGVIYDQDSPVIDAYEDASGNVNVSFANGKSITLDGEGYESPIDEFQYMFQTEGNRRRKAPELNLPNYVMKNGEEMNIEDVERVLNDIAYMSNPDEKKDLDDPGVNYDFGLLNERKPQSMTGELTKGDWGDIVPIAWDTVASSAPYFAKKIAWPVGLSNAYTASRDIDPYQTESDRTYVGPGKIGDDVRAEMEEQGVDVDEYEKRRNGSNYVQRIGANAFMPLTEYGWGNIGEKVSNPIVKLMHRKLGDKAWMPAADWASGVIGEGLEEIPGNIMEEGTREGFTDSWYADYLRDRETGEILRDENGMPLKAYNGGIGNTENYGRFWEDAPESFILGSGLGLGIGGIPKLPGTIRETRDLMSEDSFKQGKRRKLDDGYEFDFGDQ